MACSGNKGQDVCQAGVQGLPGRGLDKADGAGFMAKATPGEGESLSRGFANQRLAGEHCDPPPGLALSRSFLRQVGVDSQHRAPILAMPKTARLPSPLGLGVCTLPSSW